MPLTHLRREGTKATFRLLLLGLVTLLFGIAFAALASEVFEGDTRALDAGAAVIAGALRAHYPWLLDVMRDLSGMGSTVTLTIAVGITVGYLLLIGHRSVGCAVAASSLSGIVAVSLLKGLFGRARPDPISAVAAATGMSFPSGHAAMSATVFLTVGALLASTRQRGSERAYILACSMVLSILVGASRVVLGVHWATDVLGGWAFGSAWATTWLLATHVWHEGSERQS